ncbi:hypothetical protein N8772_01790 [Rickettsiales bacterium]|nr:hypothetical protein [Rickettsiales bacterium]
MNIIYKIIIKIFILAHILFLNSCVISENPGSGYINPRYPSSAPYGYNPYQANTPSYTAPSQVAPAAPGSRYYTNPYDFPQPNYYQYYDTDRYYKPPNSYNTRSSADSR